MQSSQFENLSSKSAQNHVKNQILTNYLTQLQPTGNVHFKDRELNGFAAMSDAIYKFMALDPQNGMNLKKRKLIQQQLPAFEADLFKALEFLPNNLELLHTIITMMIYKRDYSTGLKLINRTLTLKPQNEQTLMYKAMLLREQGDFSQAVEVMQDLIRIHNLGTYHFFLAECYESLQEVESALKHLQLAKKMDYNLPGVELELAKVQLALEKKANNQPPIRLMFTNSFDFWTLVAGCIYTLDDKYFIGNDDLQTALLQRTMLRK